MRVTHKLLAIATITITAASLIAGGFSVEIGKPSANPEAQAKHAVLVVRGYACSTPEKIAITAMAEGLVNGKRETIPLKLIPLSAQSTYALTRQWPSEGKWVITLVGANPSFRWQPSAIVQVDGESVQWGGVARFSHAPAEADVEAALNTPQQSASTVASKF